MRIVRVPDYHREKGGWVLDQDVDYYSPRYRKWVRIKKGQWRDGASGAMDIISLSWWVHDELCENGTWDDGTLITNWQASSVLSDILQDEGRYMRARYWFIMTWLFGCERARKNGMF